MTEKLELLLKSAQKGDVIDSIRAAVVQFNGPLSQGQLWKMFGEDPLCERMRGQLVLRDSADAFAGSMMDIVMRQAKFPTTDALLRVVQRNVENDIYPGARKDLGL